MAKDTASPEPTKEKKKKKNKIPGWVLPAGIAAGSLGLGVLAHRLNKPPSFHIPPPRFKVEFKKNPFKKSYEDFSNTARRAREDYERTRRAYEASAQAKKDAEDFADEFERQYKARQQQRQQYNTGTGAGAGAQGSRSKYVPPPGSPGKAEAFKFFGFAPGADMSEVKKVYKKMMMKAHPDRGGSRDEAAKINAMYDLIKNGSVLIKMAFSLGIF